MTKDFEQDLDLSRLALSLARPSAAPEEVATALRDQLASLVPDVDDDVCSAALQRLAHAAAEHATSASADSEAEMRDAVQVATAFCQLRRGRFD